MATLAKQVRHPYIMADKKIRGDEPVVSGAIEKGLIGAADIEHFKFVSEMQAVIFTHDHHFLEIARDLAKEGIIH